VPLEHVELDEAQRERNAAADRQSEAAAALQAAERDLARAESDLKSAERELEKAVIRQLATCGWVAEHHNIAIVGAAGTGKSWIGCALAQQAMRRGYRAVYRRAPRFFDHEIVLAHADGTYGNLLSRIARIDVLILDDWALAAASERERRDLLEILEDRQGLRSTIITSQLPTDRWHAHVGDPMLADAICDRFLSRAHRIALKGPSRRPPLVRDGEKK
jgi:DNA replication protein DnaC